MIFKQAQIDKYFKKVDLGLKAFVIYGSNEGLVAEYIKQLVQTVSKDLYDPFSVVHLDEVDEGALSSEYNSRSLMGGRRVIVIKDADNNLTKILKKVLESSSSDTLIIASSLSLNKTSSLVKLGEEREDMAVIACYEDRDESIYSTVRQVFVEQGFSAANDVLQFLCSRLSNDRKTNLSEIEKLITYMGTRKVVSIEDVRDLISDASSSNTDDVCYYTASGMSEQAQSSLVSLINEGVEPVSIIRALGYHFNKILQCKSVMEEGETLDKALYKLTPRVIFFRETSFRKQVNVWSNSRIFDVLDLIYKCERDLKTTNMPNFEVLSYTLLQISGAANRLMKA